MKKSRTGKKVEREKKSEEKKESLIKMGRISESRSLLLEMSRSFNNLGDFYSQQGDAYRSKTFYKAAKVIASLKVTEESDIIPTIQNIKGIGKGVIARVEEFLLTRTFSDEGFENTPLQRSELEKVYGIGPAKIKELNGKSIYTIAQLKVAFDNGDVDLTPTQEFGMIHYSDLNERIPREEVQLIGERLLALIESDDPKNVGKIVGSYRRGLQTSGDVDIIFTNSDGRNHLKKIIGEIPEIVNVFSIGDYKFHGAMESPYSGKVRIFDISYVPMLEWESSVLHYTGSKNFNVYLRKCALSRGLSLSEKGLVDGKGKRLEMSENEIIRYLTGRDYSPSEREGEFTDIKGDLTKKIEECLSLLEGLDGYIQSKKLTSDEREEVYTFNKILLRYSESLGV